MRKSFGRRWDGTKGTEEDKDEEREVERGAVRRLGCVVAGEIRGEVADKDGGVPHRSHVV